MSFDLRTALTTIAPTIATMLAGPLAGTAITALESAFGLAPGAGAEGITAVIQGGQMTPEILAAVRAADQRHAEVLGQQSIDVLKINSDHDAAIATIEAGDRDSARKREIAVGGITTAAMAWLVVGSSVALGAAVICGAVTKDPAQAALVGTVVGYVFGEAKQVLAYMFGQMQAQASSARKTELLAQAPAIEP